MSNAFAKGLALLDRVVREGVERPIASIADDIGLPRSTVYRLLGVLEGQGLVTRISPGHYLPGPRLTDYGALADPRALMMRIARPILRDAATKLGETVHLGVFEDRMVTYLVKESAAAAPLFTLEQRQLEAYCSGIGKMLLAHLPEEEREAYLRTGPFVGLTASTITDPVALRGELNRILDRGYSVDDGEALEGLNCLAVPVRDAAGHATVALSAATFGVRGTAATALALRVLRDAARQVERGIAPLGPMPA